MPKINFKDCMVVGIDVHKYSHTAVLMDPFSQVLARYTFNNSIDKLEKFRKSIELKTQNQNVIYALEDTGGFGEKLTKFLGQYDCVVYSVPSIYVNNKRKNTPHADKSDVKDAQRVAQVLLQDSERLSQTIINEKTEVARNLKGLVDDRNQLITDRTGLKNQLHTLLHSYFGDEYRKRVKYKDIFCKRAVKQWISILEKGKSFKEKRMLGRFKMIQVIEEQIIDFDNEIEKFTTDNKEIELLQTIPSCGKLIASMIIAEIKDINRFRSSSALAKYCGIAPRTHDSASSIRHYIDFRGNRKLNHAFYRLALSQVNPNGSNLGRKYFSKKIDSGKSKMHALRCLKRRLVDVVYQVLRTEKPFTYERYL